jgi:hypothetical protein
MQIYVKLLNNSCDQDHYQAGIVECRRDLKSMMMMCSVDIIFVQNLFHEIN